MPSMETAGRSFGAGHLARGMTQAAAGQAGELSWGVCSARKGKEKNPVQHEQVAGEC